MPPRRIAEAVDVDMIPDLAIIPGWLRDGGSLLAVGLSGTGKTRTVTKPAVALAGDRNVVLIGLPYEQDEITAGRELLGPVVTVLRGEHSAEQVLDTLRGPRPATACLQVSHETSSPHWETPPSLSVLPAIIEDAADGRFPRETVIVIDEGAYALQCASALTQILGASFRRAQSLGLRVALIVQALACLPACEALSDQPLPSDTDATAALVRLDHEQRVRMLLESDPAAAWVGVSDWLCLFALSRADQRLLARTLDVRLADDPTTGHPWPGPRQMFGAPREPGLTAFFGAVADLDLGEAHQEPRAVGSGSVS